MEGFFPLIEQFSTQDEPAFCGLASLAMVMNTLQIDPVPPPPPLPSLLSTPSFILAVLCAAS